MGRKSKTVRYKGKEHTTAEIAKYTGFSVVEIRRKILIVEQGVKKISSVFEKKYTVCVILNGAKWTAKKLAAEKNLHLSTAYSIIDLHQKGKITDKQFLDGDITQHTTCKKAKKVKKVEKKKYTPELKTYLVCGENLTFPEIKKKSGKPETTLRHHLRDFIAKRITGRQLLGLDPIASKWDTKKKETRLADRKSADRLGISGSWESKNKHLFGGY